MRWPIVVVLGCYTPVHLSDDDAGTDGKPGGTQVCIGEAGSGSTAFQRSICVDATSIGGAVVFTSETIDTDHDTRCLAGGFSITPSTAACVIAGDSIIVQQQLTAHGQRALVLFAVSGATFGGFVDVSSHAVGNVAGAGNGIVPTACGNAQIDGGSSGALGAGAGGGSHIEVGGRGGSTVDSAFAGVPVNALAPDFVAGCPGGRGGGGAADGGAGGSGGGALYIASQGSVMLNAGGLLANGAGGSPGTMASGGGGGGAGGTIVVDAPMIASQDILLRADGGGGGGGGGSANPGSPGGEVSGTATPRGGDAGGTNTGSGGDGSVGGVGGQAHDGTSGGGGGGGGAAGCIRLRATPGGVTTSSPAYETF